MNSLSSNYLSFPDDLPRPVDDGAADHLAGRTMPDIELQATSGASVNLSRLGQTVVVYAYPMTGVPGVPLPEGWNDIPGARGCTPESLAFRSAHQEIIDLGAEVFGLSTQDTAYQQEMTERLGLTFPVLSDAAFRLTHALELPTMRVDGKTLLKRLTLIIRGGRIAQAFYPVFPPDQAPEAVLAWLRANLPAN
jgi:peroxiredoxin